MIELSNEIIEKILHKETAKKEELPTILRGIYTRYMRLYEKYFADTEALNEEMVADLRKYHEETRSLIRYYYMDIPLDICMKLDEFDEKYSDNLLGAGWHEYLDGLYKDFREADKNDDQDEKRIRAAFTKQTLSTFYDAMDYVFREGFGTGSQTAKKVLSGITELIFGKES